MGTQRNGLLAPVAFHGHHSARAMTRSSGSREIQGWGGISTQLVCNLMLLIVLAWVVLSQPAEITDL